jgi:hypothetical protein
MRCAGLLLAVIVALAPIHVGMLCISPGHVSVERPGDDCCDDAPAAPLRQRAISDAECAPDCADSLVLLRGCRSDAIYDLAPSPAITLPSSASVDRNRHTIVTAAAVRSQPPAAPLHTIVLRI